jgi:hypothetical protein
VIINKKINDALAEISAKSVSYGNSKDERRKYIRRLLNLYTKHLSEDEQIYLVSYLLENIHFKNVLIDPETMLTANNIKLRTIFVALVVGGTIEMIILFMFKKGIFFQDGFKVMESLLKFLTL